MRRLIILIACLLLLLTSFSFSQDINPIPKQQNNKVEVIAKTYMDSIVIRWAPNSAEVWQYGNKYGYIIERSTLAKDTNYFLHNPNKVLLTGKPITPVPLTQWEILAQQDSYAGIAAQAIYGSSFEVAESTDEFSTFVNKAKEMENRFSFSLFAADQSVKVAQAHGLRFVDRTVKKNEKYLYRVHIQMPDATINIETGFVYIATLDTVSIPQPQQLKVEFGDRMAQLSWDKLYYEHTFTSYILERTHDLSKGFHRINQPPLINPTSAQQQPVRWMYTTDSLPVNGVTYYYRIRGVTSFGEISAPSDTVSGKGVPAGLPVNPIIVRHKLQSDKQVNIQWEFPEEYNEQIKGFLITRSDRTNGKYDTLTQSLILSEQRFFMDEHPLPVNYYVVQSVDRQGRFNRSLPALVQLDDSIPPLSPLNVEGHIDSTGIVSIFWQENTEPDLAGYRILMSNHSEGPFVQVSDQLVVQNQYAEETVVKTLSRYIYYRIVAVDQHYNRSEPSQVLRLERPDLIPPAPPIFQKVVAMDSSIHIAWLTSPSDDVVKHVIYRRKVHTNEWQTIAVVDGNYINTVSTYQDENVVPGETYEYTMVAVDKAGMESERSVSRTVDMIDDGLREAIKQFYGKADRPGKQVQLAWNSTATNVEKFLLFRTSGDQSIRLLKALPGDRNTFYDHSLVVNTTYTYRIQAIYADGAQSPLSEELVVKY